MYTGVLESVLARNREKLPTSGQLLKVLRQKIVYNICTGGFESVFARNRESEGLGRASGERSQDGFHL